MGLLSPGDVFIHPDPGQPQTHQYMDDKVPNIA